VHCTTSTSSCGGLLLSENGFQAGAIRLAERSQVTLTNLEELHERSTSELLLLTLAGFRRRLALLTARLDPLSHAGRHSAGMSVAHPHRGVDLAAVLRLHAALGTAENGLRQADANDWPVTYGWDFAQDRLLVADDPQQLWAGLPTVSERPGLRPAFRMSPIALERLRFIPQMVPFGRLTRRRQRVPEMLRTVLGAARRRWRG
jgi:hypothetical protein